MSLIIFYGKTDENISEDSSEDNSLSTAYLQPTNVEYTADIHDRFALCKLRQTFNITTDTEEAQYQFPVDYNSAFCDLTIQTPREEIKGCVKEKSQAKQTYDQGKKEGKQVFLAEQTESDRDIYKLSMGNLLLGDKIIVEYTYVTEVAVDNGSNIFYIPSFISPRYEGIYIPDAEHSVTANIKINNKLRFIKSSMPNITMYFENNFVRLEHKSNEVLDNDIEIIYDASLESYAHKFTIGKYTLAMAQFVPQINNDNNSNKEIVFILDCSGSMQGERIENSKKAIIHCLKQMINADFQYRFNIVTFGSTHKIFSPVLLESSKSNINVAIEYCNNINADMGGTEIYNALNVALVLSKTAILITDGDTTNNGDLHKLCCEFDCLSILGIGSGINRANIKDMSTNGSGIALFSQTDQNIFQNMNSIFGMLNTPIIKNSQLNWSGNWWTKYPIISGQLNISYGILNENPDIDQFVINELDLKLEFEQSNCMIEPKYLACLIAKRIIQENRSLSKEQIIDLAVNFNIITEYTSMVAVGKEMFYVHEKKGVRGPSGDVGDTGLSGSTNYNKFITNKHTDYLFDYFINEDRFNDQLRGEWEKEIEERLNRYKSPINNIQSDDSYDSEDTTNDNKLINGNTDHLFDYFVSEEDFNKQLRGEWDKDMNEKLSGSPINNTKSDDSYDSEDITDGEAISENDNMSDIEEEINNFSEADVEIYKLIFEYMSKKFSQIKTNNLNFDVLCCHFYKPAGLFMRTVSNVINDIPKILLDDEIGLTLYVLYFLHDKYQAEFQTFKQMAIKNKHINELIDKLIF